MPLLIIILIIVAIIIIVSVSKKNKKKKLKKRFRENLPKQIQALENNNAYFEERYNDIMEEIGEITKTEIESILKRIPQLKIQFSNVCEKLIQLSEKNICLTSNQDILNEFKETEYLPEGKERIARDMVEALPVLGDYFDLHKQLHDKIYHDVLFGKFHNVNSLAFGFLIESADEYVSKEAFDKKVNSGFDYVFYNYNVFVDQIIRQTLKLPVNFDVRNSTVKEVKELVSIANEKEFRQAYVFDIWFPIMQSIGRRYAEAHVDLYNYFDDINSKLKAQIEWFSIHYFHPPVGGRLYLKEYTKEECERILKLYKEGKIKGENSFMY